MEKSKRVITRFAPSPTGFLHIGNIRLALINWLCAKALQGKFILRIDDTDAERSTLEYEKGIKEDLEWLGLHWDGFFRQSERIELYNTAKVKLIESGRLYPCYEMPEELAFKKKLQLSRGLPPIYDRAALSLTEEKKQELESQGVSPHWRFKLDETETSWEDVVKGYLHFDAKNLGDPILIKTDGTMTYALASVVDDIALNISHVIRGEDHLSNTATHIQMFKALGSAPPTFAHISLLMSKTGEISKRIGGFDIRSLRDEGIEPIAISNYLAKIGSSDSIEYRASLHELVNEFSFSKFSKSSLYFSAKELEQINKKIVHNLPYAQVCGRFKTNLTEDFWNIVKYDIDKISKADEWYNICYSRLNPKIDEENLNFTKIAASLLPEGAFNAENYKIWINKLKEITKKSGHDLFSPLRMALTGVPAGPGLELLLPFIERTRIVGRLNGEEA